MNRSFDEVVEVSTPERVAFQFRLGGLGSRFIALSVDLLVQIVMIVVVYTALFIVGVGLSTLIDIIAGGKTTLGSAIANTLLALAIISLFLIQWGYFVFFEVRRGGQTPGKRLMHLRVVRDKGQPVRFFDSVIRNILRIVDALPGTQMVGVVSILANKRNKRVGDLAAGTIVVREASLPAPAHAAAAAAIESDDAALIAEFLRRREQMSPAGRLETARTLAKLAGVEEDGDEDVLSERLRQLVGAG